MRPIDLRKVRAADAHLDDAERLRARAGHERRTIPDDDLTEAFMTQQTYNVQEVADLAGYSTETVRRHIRADRLKAAQTGRGSYRISRPELARWWREELDGGELFDGDDAKVSIRVIAAGCALEAVRAAGSAPYDSDGESLLPREPLAGDWAALGGTLGREPTDEERDIFCDAYAEGIELLVEG